MLYVIFSYMFSIALGTFFVSKQKLQTVPTLFFNIKELPRKARLPHFKG